MEEMRLNRYLAACGICSRRDADKLIEQGVVTVSCGVKGYTTKIEKWCLRIINQSVLPVRSVMHMPERLSHRN